MNNIRIAIIGLGYVGLPLARLFSTKFPTIGFDINPNRVEELMSGYDSTGEIGNELLQEALQKGLLCTTKIEEIRDCNFYIVTVPTPIDHNHTPDLRRCLFLPLYHPFSVTESHCVPTASVRPLPVVP